MRQFISADMGTTSIKAGIITDQLEILKECRIPLVRNDKYRSQEWLGAFIEAVKILKAETPDFNPDSIVISGNGPTLTCESFETLMWNDTTPQVQINQMDFRSIYLPRIASFCRLYPDAVKNNKYIFSGPEFLIWQLCGTPLTILPDVRFIKFYWVEKLLKENNTPVNIFPEFKLSGSLAGTIKKEISEQLELSDNIKIYCGAPDFISALVGTGTTINGTLCDRAGSSEGINLCTDKEIQSANIRLMPSIISGLHNASVLIPQSGTTLDKAKRNVEKTLGQKLSFEEFINAAMNNDGTIPELDQAKYSILQTAMNAADAINTLKNACLQYGADFPDEMTITGGQSESESWIKIREEICGIKIKKLNTSNAELIGNVKLVLKK